MLPHLCNPAKQHFCNSISLISLMLDLQHKTFPDAIS